MAANRTVDIEIVALPKSLRLKGLARRAPRSNGFVDLTGREHGDCKIIGFAGIRNGYAVWLLECACGKQLLANNKSIDSGRRRHCGCKNKRRTIHGLSYEPIYGTWHGMLDRCYRKNHKAYKDYGARGIKVCDRWRNSVKAFAEDIGPRPSNRHTLDRYPNTDGDYEPGNVRWATWEQQAATRRIPCTATAAYRALMQSA